MLAYYLYHSIEVSGPRYEKVPVFASVATDDWRDVDLQHDLGGVTGLTRLPIAALYHVSVPCEKSCVGEPR